VEVLHRHWRIISTTEQVSPPNNFDPPSLFLKEARKLCKKYMSGTILPGVLHGEEMVLNGVHNKKVKYFN
jgi:hypothetical protein